MTIIFMVIKKLDQIGLKEYTSIMMEKKLNQLLYLLANSINYYGLLLVI